MKLPTFSRMASVAGAALMLSTLVASPLILSAQEAQETPNGFRITPVRTPLTIEKGQSETFPLTLKNPSDAPVTARAIVNDFVPSDKEDGEPRLILDDDAESPKNSIKDLIQPIPNVQLDGGEEKEIQVTAVVPEDANAGGYYGAIRFVPVRDGEIDGNVGLTASVGSLVLIRVPGDLTERLDLVQLSAAQDGKAKSFLTSGNVQVLTRLKNSGDIHVQPFGKVLVKNMFGKTVAEYELNHAEQEGQRSNVLPGSTRSYVDDLEDQTWLGRYTISANLGYAQGSGDVITAQSSFWYLPAWAIAVLVAVLAALVFGGYLLYNKYASPTPRKRK